MVLLDKLPTKDRLERFSIPNDGLCSLCMVESETKNHLFPTCHYAHGVWRRIFFICGLQCHTTSWEEDLVWAETKLRGKPFVVLVLNLAWTGYLYCIWEERNFRLYRGSFRSVDTIVENIREFVRLELYSSRIDRGDELCWWGFLVSGCVVLFVLL
ncbi:uncharacterized protein LOC120200050 [Hibiscus syriacus]|uniref:uncharacterized protein LOC120200050 n=1 Tax=Hibiscus syriacus TaxID=106335 RepID=UPI00192244EF|nr:uncharacterized protein LOC120200050 [Hibiscus syriacus]